LFKTRFYQSYFTDPTDCEEKGGGGGWGTCATISALETVA
jgi:hypothetical protein